mmetsp:Transcript_36640/g.114049  ORF Transcript_36640/g.114049 Transcript_36640/m.114049 type:complete len:402 (-) Transcript_36640:165-1370(-)
MMARTATIFARMSPLLPSSPSASASRRASIPPLSMRCWRVFWSPTARSMHSAAWSWAAWPSAPGVGRLSAPRIARKGAGDCCSSCVPALTLEASSAERPASPLDRRQGSSDCRKGSNTRRPTSARSTSAPFGLSESASSVKAAARSPCRGAPTPVPSADSRHLRSAPVGMSGCPCFPRRRRVSHIVARAVTPARETPSPSPSAKTSASWTDSNASASSGSWVKPTIRARYRIPLACPRQHRRRSASCRELPRRLRTSSTPGATGNGSEVEPSCRGASSSSSSLCSRPDAMAKSTASASPRTTAGVSAQVHFSTSSSTAPACSNESVHPLCTQRPLSLVQASTASSAASAPALPEALRRTSSKRLGRTSSRFCSPDLINSSRSRFAASTAARFFGSARATLA